MSGRFEFVGRRALITGAASGIGAALARDLAGRGTDLLLVDVNSAGLKALAAELAGSGVTVRTRALDLSDREAVAAFRPRSLAGTTRCISCSTMPVLLSAELLTV